MIRAHSQPQQRYLQQRSQTILITTDTIGGVWTYTLDLMHALDPEYYRITLATLGKALSAEQRTALAQLPHVTVHESTYKLEWMDEPWHDVDASGRWLNALASSVQPALIHLNSYAHAALPWQAPVIVVAHSCVLSWWQAVKGEEAPNRYTTYRRRVQAGLAAADIVVAPTHAMLCALTDIYGPLPKTHMIPNGRNLTSFQPAAPEARIFSVGRFWDEAKNVAALEQIAAQLPWPVEVAGSTEHPNGSTIQLTHTKALGHITPAAVADHMGRAAIYALPARYEPFGLSILEAAAAGCALVLGDIPTLRENWQDVALFVAPDDERMLAAALTLLINDEAPRQRLSQQARRRASQFTRQRMGAHYHTLYQQLITQTPDATSHAAEKDSCAN